jgi:hypothetical protein
MGSIGHHLTDMLLDHFRWCVYTCEGVHDLSFNGFLGLWSEGAWQHQFLFGLRPAELQGPPSLLSA